MNDIPDFEVMETLIRHFGNIQDAESYSRRLSHVPGGYYSAQYGRIAKELRIRIDLEFQKRLVYLAEVSRLPGYHPVDGDLGSVPTQGHHRC